MASAIRTLVVCICTVTATCADFISVQTENSIGFSGQASKLGCVVKAQQEIKITHVYWKKNDKIVLRMEKEIVQTEKEYSRLQFADTDWKTSKDVSLLLINTKISDQGNYSCTVVTNRGIKKEYAKLVVKAKYSHPDMTYELLEPNSVNLTCVTSGGYPKGAIHWFDGFNTNWTRSAKDSEIQNEQDQSITLKSTFISKDTLHGPYRCIVYNSDWEEEGRVEKNCTVDEYTQNSPQLTNEQTKNIAAGVVVIGSLTCGLLVALLCFRRRSQRADRRPSTQPMLNAEPDPEQDHETKTGLVEEI